MPLTSCFGVVTARRYVRSAAVFTSAATLLTLALAAQASDDLEVEGASITSDRIASGPNVGADIFDIPVPGERFKPLTGEVGHVATDLSMAGDGLLRFDLIRRHQLHPGAYPYALGTMSIDVPTLSYRTKHSAGRPRDATDNTCLNLTVVDTNGNRVLSSVELFDDLRFNYGDISISLLPRRHVALNVLSNYPSASEAIAISKENWLFRCDGDTFVVQSPDATEYRFNGRINSELVIRTETSLTASAEAISNANPNRYRHYDFHHYLVKASSIQRLNASVDLAYETVPEVQVGGIMRDAKARWPYHSSFEGSRDDLIDHVLRNPRRLTQVH